MPDGQHAKEPGLSTRPSWRVLGGWLAVFSAALLLYTLTANRGAQWQDGGDIALRIYRQELGNRLGLALVHALHYWLGRLALAVTDLEPVFAITLVSAVAAAAAVANVFGCVWTTTRRLPAAVFAAASLAVANTFWHLATITEVYTLTAALLAAECWCLLALGRGAGRYALWGMLLFNGLGIANHLQSGLTTPVLLVVAVVAWRQRRVGLDDLAIGAALWLLGTLPYSGLVAVELARSGDLAGTLQSALVGKFGARVANLPLSLGFTGISLAFLVFSFPNLLLPAAVYGMAKARRIGVPSLARRALLAGLILHALFVFRYNIPDQYTFLLPVFVFLCIFGGFGAAAVLGWSSARQRRGLVATAVALLIATPLVYWAVTSVLRHYGVLGRFLYHKPYRDDYEYLLIPWSVVEVSAERMSREAVQLAGEDGLIVTEDPMARFAIEYRVLRSGRERLETAVWPGAAGTQTGKAALLEQARQKATGPGRVVLVPLNRNSPAMPPPVGSWQRTGDLYVLDPSRR